MIEAARNHWANHVQRHGFQKPDEPALRWQGTTITWGSLAEQVRRTADAFAARGLGFGDRLALLTFNRPEFLIATFAATRLGAIVVPINFRLTPGEIDYVLADATPAILVVDAHLVASLPADVAAKVVVTAADGALRRVPSPGRRLTALPSTRRWTCRRTPPR